MSGELGFHSLALAAAREKASEALAFGKGQSASNVRGQQRPSAAPAASALRLRETQKHPVRFYSDPVPSPTFKAERSWPGETRDLFSDRSNHSFSSREINF